MSEPRRVTTTPPRTTSLTTAPLTTTTAAPAPAPLTPAALAPIPDNLVKRLASQVASMSGRLYDLESRQEHSAQIDALKMRLSNVEQRNKTKEKLKAWEGSWVRTFAIMALAYSGVTAFLVYLKVEQPFVQAAIPTSLYFLSTWSLIPVRICWSLLLQPEEDEGDGNKDTEASL